MTENDKRKITLASLKKIYEELPKLAEKDPSIINDFNMNHFGVYQDLKKKQIDNNVCGTMGCGLGNSARLFELESTDFNSVGTFSYNRFGQRILPFCYEPDEDDGDGCPLMIETSLWDFLFSHHWATIQPRFDQFIERVKYAIDKDLDLGHWLYKNHN